MAFSLLLPAREVDAVNVLTLVPSGPDLEAADSHKRTCDPFMRSWLHSWLRLRGEEAFRPRRELSIRLSLPSYPPDSHALAYADPTGGLPFVIPIAVRHETNHSA